MNEIEKYYNKFNEDKRLLSRHGIVEFTTSMHYINKYAKNKCLNICDVGAGTGRYSIALSDKGHNVTAVELVKKNLSVLKEKAPNICAMQGDALNLKKLKDNSFDIVILFGPMYHLFGENNKIQALNEAKRIVKSGGYIFVAYLLNDYAVIRHGFMDNNIQSSLKNKKLNNEFTVLNTEQDLYSYDNLKQIDHYKNMCGLKRKEIISPDGPTDYIRNYINKLSEEDFKLYLDFVLKISNDKNRIGASSHIVDILQKV